MEFNERLNNLFDALGLNEAVSAKEHGRKHGKEAEKTRRKRQKAVEPVAGEAQAARHKAFYGLKGTADERRDAGDAAAQSVRMVKRRQRAHAKKTKPVYAEESVEVEMTAEILAEALYNALFDMAVMISEVRTPTEVEAAHNFGSKGSRARGKRQRDLGRLPADRRAAAIARGGKKLSPEAEKKHGESADTAAAKKDANARDAAKAEPRSAPKRTEP